MDAGALPALGRNDGPNTEGLVIAILANRPHSEQGFRSCLGIIRLFRGIDRTRAEAVAARALAISKTISIALLRPPGAQP
jgi:hypothetical protein